MGKTFLERPTFLRDAHCELQSQEEKLYTTFTERVNRYTANAEKWHSDLDALVAEQEQIVAMVRRYFASVLLREALNYTWLSIPEADNLSLLCALIPIWWNVQLLLERVNVHFHHGSYTEIHSFGIYPDPNSVVQEMFQKAEKLKDH